MKRSQVLDMEHALKNGNRFYDDAHDEDWNDLVEKGYASKHPGWDEDSAYYRVTVHGKEALELTEYQIGKLIHCFGLEYSGKPFRNYYICNDFNQEWEDMIAKGYAEKEIWEDGSIHYYGTLKGLRKVYRKNITQSYYDKFNK